MKKSLTLLFALGILPWAAAQRPASLPDLRPLLDSIETLRQQEQMAGLMVGIVTADSVLFTGGFGYADVENKRPADAQTLFRMGSITKMFVSIGILQLVAGGRLRLDDELKKIAPEVPFQNAWEATDPVRIVHLLEHTTGFDDIQLNRMYAPEGEGYHGIEQMLIHRPSFVARWKPGERTAYSNPNYAILGYVVEKLSGKPWEQYLTETILQPLGMRHSNFNRNSKFPMLDTREYIVRNGAPVRVAPVTLPSGPPGALWSSAEEMAYFVQVFLRNGRPLLAPEWIHEMETCHSSLAARSGLKDGYALGNRTGFLRAKYPFHGHDGLAGTCFSTLNYNRDLGVGFVLASNSNQPTDRIGQLIVDFLAEHFPIPPRYQPLAAQALDTQALRPYLGMYQLESPRNAISGFRDRFADAPRIFLRDGKLYYKPLFDDASELVQTGPLTFTWVGLNTALIVFARNDAGRPVLTIGGAYYERVDAWWAMVKRVLVLLAALLAAASIPAGLLSLVQAIRFRAGWRAWAPRLLPMTGVAALSWAVINLLEVQEETFRLAELGAVNTRTLSIFLGTTIFGATAIITLLPALRDFRRTRPRWLAGYDLLTAISLGLLAAILAQNGWIGLRTWAL